MNSTTLICKRCKAPLEYEEGSSVARCPHCGYTELIDETDELKLERIRAKAYKDTEIERSKLQAGATIVQDQIKLEKKRLGLKKLKIFIAIIIALAIIVFGVWLGFKIKHKDEIKIPLDSISYCQRDYKETCSLLEDAGFTNIEYVILETLTKNEQKLENIVTQVSINGTTSFDADIWFPKSSVVKITYRVLDPKTANDIEMPVSNIDCIGVSYQNIVDTLTKAGFHNIKTVDIADLPMARQNEIDKITDISIDNNSNFHQGEFYSPNAAIYITYHILDPERISDVQIPNVYDYYIDKNYIDVCKEFRDADFNNITLVPKYDLKITEGSKKDLVKEVTINGVSSFVQGTWLPYDTPIRITYRTDQMKYVDKKQEDINNQLSGMGFNNISLIPLKDLDPKDYNKAGKIESVLIDGIDFNEATELSLSAHIEIKYHSEREASSGEIKVSEDSSKLVGQPYESVIDTLKSWGFSNISVEAADDLLLPIDIFSQEGKVKEISINGTNKFSKGDIFDKDAEIKITYHSKK